MIKSLTRRHTWIVAAACLALAAGSARADVAESHKFEARELEVHNLIGEITVEGHAGRAFEVDVRIQGGTPRRSGCGSRPSRENPRC